MESKYIEILKRITTFDLLNCWSGGMEEYEAIQYAIKLLEEKDKKVQQIINRLENDCQRITKKIEDKKSENHGYLPDYDKGRLKAYRTKTREIKEYIEKIYFGKE